MCKNQTNFDSIKSIDNSHGTTYTTCNTGENCITLLLTSKKVLELLRLFDFSAFFVFKNMLTGLSVIPGGGNM